MGEALEHLSRSEAGNRVSSLRCFYRYAVSQGWRDDDPTEGMKIKRTQRQAPKPFTHEEIRALLRAARSHRDRAIVLILASTGVRRGELVGMERRDIDWQREMILIRHGKGAKERLVAPGRLAMQALHDYLGEFRERDGAVWLGPAGPLTGERVLDIIYRLGQAAGVEGAYVHRFRVSFANTWLDAGHDLVSLQHCMGHSKIEMTAHYSRFNAAKRGLEMQRGLLDQVLTAQGNGHSEIASVETMPMGAPTQGVSMAGNGSGHTGWAELRKGFRDHLLSSYSRTTAATYATCLSRYARWCQDRGLSLPEPAGAAVSDYLSEEQARKPSQDRARRAALRAFYWWALEEGYTYGDIEGGALAGGSIR